MKKTPNKDLFAGYDKIWQKGPEVKREYTSPFEMTKC
jgi:hypothetical protein